MYLWSLIDDSSRTSHPLVVFIRLEEVSVMSITDCPTGEWKVGVDPLLRMFKPNWNKRFSSFSPLLSKVFEPHRLLWAFESIPQISLMLDVLQCSIACVSLMGISLFWPAQYADISHMTSVLPVLVLVFHMHVHTSLSLNCGIGHMSRDPLCRMAALIG